MLNVCLREALRKMARGARLNLLDVLVIEESFIELLDPTTRQPLVDSNCQARIGHVRLNGYRKPFGSIMAKFERWAFKCTLNVDYAGMEGLTEEHVRKLLNIGGKRVGIGSFRPSTSGPHGRFQVTGWQTSPAS